MTTSPNDLLAFRSQVMSETGLTDPVEVGIVGDDAHGVGYHLGVQSIKNRGNYPTSDYSTRQSRDRVSADFASAMDIGDNWPRGGRAAWIRFNNNVSWELIHNPGALPALRAMNFTPDGSAKKRYDTFNPSQGIINSDDTVDIHTHVEFWRNTIDARSVTLTRLRAHVIAARDNISVDVALATLNPAAPNYKEVDMIPILRVTSVPAGSQDIFGVAVPENGLVMTTPKGRVSVRAAWWASMSSQAPLIMTVTWAEASLLCGALAQDLNITAGEINQQEIIAALTSDDGQGALNTAVLVALQSPHGRDAIAAGANQAEDS